MRRILERLREAYGPRPAKRWGRAVDILVETILSQNTNDRNSSAGYRILRRDCSTWNIVMNAPVEVVERAIRISGLSRIKAPRIQKVLREIKTERATIDLQFLADWEPPAAREYLLKFDGVGPKTADCVLLFAFGMGVFPVDTHIHRIAGRMGWIYPEASAETAHRVLEPVIAPEDRYETHVLLIEHGRKTCKAGRPACGRCVLRRMCRFAKKAGRNDE